jgi:hypothetical protein
MKGLEHFSPFLFYSGMNFRINLKPFPGAEYFTFQEHLRKFSNTLPNKVDLTKEIELKLKKLFNILENYSVSMVSANNPDWSFPDYEVLVKDDPISGIDHLNLPHGSKHQKSMLDLSYSFPQITGYFVDFRSIFIHPAASLGIPVINAVVFSRDKIDSIPTFSQSFQPANNYQKSMFLMNAVLDDYLEKGSEVLLRESNYKAAVLYQLLEASKNLELIAAKTERSKTMITAVCEPEFLPRILKLGYEVESFLKDGKRVLTIANYPTHSKEAIEMFADRIAAL